MHAFTSVLTLTLTLKFLIKKKKREVSLFNKSTKRCIQRWETQYKEDSITQIQKVLSSGPVLIVVLIHSSRKLRHLCLKTSKKDKNKLKCKTLPVSAETLVSSRVIAVLYHFKASFTFPCRIIW